MSDPSAPGQSDDGSRAFRKLREQAARAKALERENRELRTDAAFRDAGLTSLSQQQRSALLAVHDGEVTADAIAATAQSLSFVPPPQVSSDEQRAHQLMAEATAGAQPSEAYPRTLVDEMREARSPEELHAILDRVGMIDYD